MPAINAAPSSQSASILRRLQSNPSSGGMVLMLAAALALGIANSPASDIFYEASAVYVGGLSVLHWINDGLMALFFLMVALEIKRDVLDCQPSIWPQRVLPGSAATGPAIIYLASNQGPSGLAAACTLPAVTDIAFALGALSLLGPAVPASLKVFLTALTVIDDLGAIVIIALFYTGSPGALAWAEKRAAQLRHQHHSARGPLTDLSFACSLRFRGNKSLCLAYLY